MKEEYYWVGFSCCPGIGPVRFLKLLHYFGSAHRAWQADKNELLEASIGSAAVESLLRFKETFSLHTYIATLERKNISVITLHSQYPQRLHAIARPPIVLYVLGDASLLRQERLLAVVGTRKITEYGKQITQTLTAELVQAGFIIVSGLAIGVDAVAHKATLEAEGKTIAVLGSGVDVCTPRENLALYRRILSQGGAIVSEVPLGTLPNKGSFPARNRIIAGLSQGVLITEGAQDSGSLITAREAIKNNCKVFAVPGPITSYVSQGPNMLIKEGAKIVTSGGDICEALGITSSQRKQVVPHGDSPEEEKIIALLESQQLYFDDIVRHTNIASTELGVLLSMMEMKGFVVRLQSGKFALA